MTDRIVENFWNTAPSGHVIANPDGRIIRANATLARWLGYEPKALCDRVFTELLTVGGRILYETHFGPLLGMGGDLNGVTVDVVTADGTRLPMFLTANVTVGADGRPELLQITVVDASDRRAYEMELLAARQQAQTEQARARVFVETLRRALLPPLLSPPNGLEAADYYFTASDDDVGGDFYDLFPLTRTAWGFFLGDVAGKGVEAAVVTRLIRYTLRAAAVFDDDPVQVLHNLNTVINQKLRDARNRFSTLVYGKMTQCDNGFDVELASGGHPPPLLFYADGSAYYADTIGGQAVGHHRGTTLRRVPVPPRARRHLDAVHRRPDRSRYRHRSRALRRRGRPAALCQGTRSYDGGGDRRCGPSITRRPRRRRTG